MSESTGRRNVITIAVVEAPPDNDVAADTTATDTEEAVGHTDRSKIPSSESSILDSTDPPPRSRLKKRPIASSISDMVEDEKYLADSEMGGEPVLHSNDEDEEEPKPRRIPPWKLFRYADSLDIIMLIIGIILTGVGSAAIPIHIYLFGESINKFLYYSLAVESSQLLSDNVTCSPTLFIQNPQLLSLTSTTNDSEAYFCNATSDPSAERILSNVFTYVCDPRATLQREIGMISIYYVIIGAVVMVALFGSTLFWNVSAYRQTRRMRQAFFQAVLRQEIGWFDVNNATELTTRLIDDVEKIQAGIGDKMAVFLQNMFYAIGCFIVAFTISWKMALVVASMFPLLIVLVFLSIAIIGSFAGKQSSSLAAAGAFAEEKLSLIRTVVAFGGERREGERYGEILKNAKIFGFKASFFTSFFVGGTFFIFFASYALAFWYGSTLIISCELSAGDIVIVYFAILFATGYLTNSLPDIEVIAVALGSVASVYEIIDREPVIDSSSDEGEPLENLEGNITFSDIIFHYPARPDVPILKGLDLEVKKGQTVALVGPSGSGKSTVVQLIQRFYNPVGGQITIDGKEIQNINLRTLRKHIGVVSQDPVLFNTTILENIQFGREDATLDDVETAARNANAHDFISQLPEGYNTQVGERGTQLSGGQKQRIAIARALVRNPKILLLDEATSALDTKSEKVVQEALDKAREGRTTIIIAHRLSTIQNADVIVALDDGRVVERGTHRELMASEGLYHELLAAQTVDEEKPKASLQARFKAAVRKAIIVKNFSKIASYGKPNYTRRVSVMSSGPSSPHRRQSTMIGSPTQRSTSQKRASRKVSTGIMFCGHLNSVGIGAVTSTSSVDEAFSENTTAVYHDPYDDNFVFDEEQEIQEPGDETEAAESKADVGSQEGATLHVPSKRSVTYRQVLEEAGEEELPKLSSWDLLKLNKPDWYFVAIGIAASALLAAIYPVLSIAFSEALRIFGLPDPAEIERETLKITGAFIALAIGIAVTYFISSFTLSLAGERLTTRLRLQSFKAMLRQEISWFDQKTNSTGALVTRLTSDASAVKGATGIRLGSVVEVVFSVIPTVIIAFEASWELSFVLLLSIPAITMFYFFEVKLLVGRSHKNKKRLEESGQLVVESINNMRTVAGLGLEHSFCAKYGELLKGPFRDGIKNVFVQAILLSVSQSIIFFLYAAGYSLGAFLVVEGRNTYDDIFRVFSVVVFSSRTLSRASVFAGDAAKAQAAAARIVSLLNRTPLIDIASNEGTKLEAIHDDAGVVAKSVDFSYPTRPNVKVLQGFDVTVKHGQTLALVGPSGSGKSTIVSLLERFYDPLSGSITVQNTDIRELNLSWLREQIGIVLQEPLLFNCSIAENIRYGALFKDVTDAEVISAAKAANIHEFIESLPKGYETSVGSKGTQLSGGQKQRISIARALVRNPKILLLDEATSALDTESEKVVQEALDKAREGRTCIVIAHRLSTIYNSDVIAVIHNGEVIESGTHSDLMAKRGAYYDLNTINK